ncbi:hypothetical protein C2G38_2048315 [Gigaspora rosea]|uniref:Uncharacterized protein n=1 Tax=Gigaspora rosea TaxID=44941 RepID=A0A397UB93_9GLOM|nr:hypothetical protein C2G38_2048315 [Gigaspora rosea]
MEELQQSNQELYEVVSQLVESNRNFEQRLYTLERVIDKEELLEEISKLKRIVHQLEEENKKKDKEISNKDRLISEFDECETKLKTRIREISKSAGTIAELADAIDRSLNDTAICKTVLTNQIKRSTRSIRRKYTNLQDLLLYQRNAHHLQQCRADRGAQIIPARNVAEDWTIAGRRSTNTVPVAPNTEGGVSIILAGMQSGQRLW